MSVQKPKTVRCAVYANSSIDGGGAADQNSIRVQTQMVEAYIADQQANGWIRLPERYEDIAQPGGALKRPALQRLMADAEAGKMDDVLIADFDCVTRSNTDRVKIIKHFRRCKVGVMGTGTEPEQISKLWHDCFLRNMASTGNKSPGPGTPEPPRARIAVYMQGDIDSMKRQFQGIVEFFHHPKFCLRAWHAPYADLEPSVPPSEQLELRRMLEDVDAGQVDCVVVQTFDRLTNPLISHEKLLAKLRERDVALLVLCPEIYHLWGKRMEEKWIAAMRWFLHETEHKVKDLPRRKELATA